MKQRLVIVGAGHAHLYLLKRLHVLTRMVREVTVINPGPWLYYSGMGPGMLSGLYSQDAIRIHVENMVRKGGGRFIEGSVIKVDPVRRILYLQHEETIPYDLVSFNTGSQIAPAGMTAVRENVFPVKPIENLVKARRLIESRSPGTACRIVIAGGGPAGVEISANIHRLLKRNHMKSAIYLIGGRRPLLHQFHENIRRHVLSSLADAHIHVLQNVRLTHVHANEAELSDGSRVPADMVFMAVGIEPSSLFRESGLPVGDDGGLRVNNQLQSVTYPDIFGGGDCIHLESKPLAKIGVYAVRQGPILFHNLAAAIQGKPLKKFIPQKKFMLILNMGNGTGIVFKNAWVWKGRTGFLLKHLIDTRFVRTYQ